MTITVKRLLACTCGIGITLMMAGASFAQQIELRAVTAWPETESTSDPFFIWKERVEERFGDRVKITYLGGREVVAPNQQAEALRNGVVDLVWTTPAYYATDLPEVIAMSFTDVPPDILRKNGAIDFMNELHAEQNLHLVGTYWLYESAIFVNEEVTSSEDLAGMKIRTGSFIPFLNALGASAIQMPLPETFTALERGVIDGMTFPEAMTDTALRPLLKYKLLPTFYAVNMSLLANAEQWAALPEDLREGMEQIAIEIEDEVIADTNAMIEEVNELSREVGMQEIMLSDPEVYLDKAYSSVWEFTRERMPNSADKLEQFFRNGAQ